MKNLLLIPLSLLIIVYSCQKEDDSYSGSTVNTPVYVATIPLVGETTITSISDSSATCDATIINDGQALITSRGICYDTVHNPSINGLKKVNGNGIGSFSTTLTGLNSSTKYYIRAFATNNAGTAYGNEISFTTN